MEFGDDLMTAAVQRILEDYDHLADPDKRELAAEVLRRAVHLDFPPLTDDELLQIAEDRFLDLDRNERDA